MNQRYYSLTKEQKISLTAEQLAVAVKSRATLRAHLHSLVTGGDRVLDAEL